jgi:hypothetical protein
MRPLAGIAMWLPCVGAMAAGAALDALRVEPATWIGWCGGSGEPLARLWRAGLAMPATHGLMLAMALCTIAASERRHACSLRHRLFRLGLHASCVSGMLLGMSMGAALAPWLLRAGASPFAAMLGAMSLGMLPGMLLRGLRRD